jgi:hypothetical protein
VRFWDASALVPLFVPEPASPRAEAWIRDDPHVAVWTLTRVELLSALARRRREEPGRARTVAEARQDILNAWARWSEITALDVVRRHAERLVERYPLRSGDALQIGAAFVAAGDDPATLDFLTFDRQQREAAGLEGFRVL